MLGLVGALVIYVGARMILAGALTLGGFVTFTAFLAFLVAPVFQIVGIGTQLSEALAGLERTQEVLREAAEDADPERTIEAAQIQGGVEFADVRFEYEPGKPVLHDVSFVVRPARLPLSLVRRRGQMTIIGLCAFIKPTTGLVRVDGASLSTVRLKAIGLN
jgi:subfamily B ATP-binding cassette protein MsbA